MDITVGVLAEVEDGFCGQVTGRVLLGSQFVGFFHEPTETVRSHRQGDMTRKSVKVEKGDMRSVGKLNSDCRLFGQ